ncbi:MAG: GGDEF domain-containing protein [Gammaproteobacteria bacterium]|nr:GGDEF domain-containing protein [Gammaproteobacteria bacterium]
MLHKLKRMIERFLKTPPVTAMFLAVFIIFAIIMYWSTIERQNSFMTNQVYFGEKAALNARQAVENALSNRKRFVTLFVEDNIELIRYLIEEPDNEELFLLIKNQLSRYIPGLFTVNVTNDDAELLISDFEGFTGKVCLSDVKNYADTGHQLLRVHPNHILYHYDILQRFESKAKDYIFFASFGLGEIQKALQYSSLEGHQLLLIRETPSALIEVTEKGARNVIKDRLDFRLTDDEMSRILSKTKIEGTHWYVLDIINHELINAFNKKLINQNVIIFFIFTLLLVFVRYLVVSSILKQSKRIHELNQGLKGLLLIDTLTGLYNKDFLGKQLDKEWSRALRDKQTITVLLIDIDHFKLYNDNYGHLQGDQCLKRVAHIIEEIFQRKNDFASRFGGEEFCVVLNDSSADNPKELLRKAHKSLKQNRIEHALSPTKPYVTFSIGVASAVPDYNTSPKSLIEQADKALYEAKASGRNKTVFSKLQESVLVLAE